MLITHMASTKLIIAVILWINRLTPSCRFYLERILDPNNTRTLIWIMSNPSTADKDKNDGTVTKCEHKTELMYKYGKIIILNLDPRRAKNPADLVGQPNPVITDINHILIQFLISNDNTDVIFAWGQKKNKTTVRVPEWLWYVNEPLCIKLCSDGITPMHPRNPSHSLGMQLYKPRK